MARELNNGEGLFGLRFFGEAERNRGEVKRASKFKEDITKINPEFICKFRKLF